MTIPRVTRAIQLSDGRTYGCGQDGRGVYLLDDGWRVVQRPGVTPTFGNAKKFRAYLRRELDVEGAVITRFIGWP